MKTRSFTIGILLTLTTSVPALACPTKMNGALTLQQAVDIWLATKNVPAGAMCVAVMKSNGSKGVRCKGNQSPGTLADSGTLFQIGSVTKTFTGTLLAKRALQDQFDIDVEDEIDPHLPADFQMGILNPVTFKQLATHTSGLPRNSNGTGNLTVPWPDIGLFVDFQNCLSNPVYCFHPSQGWEYSNFGFSVLGFTLAHADGHGGDWPEDIDDAVLDPLEMGSTQVYERWAANAPAEFAQNAAHGYEPGLFEWVSVGTDPHWLCPAHNPSGCLYSSTHDMRLWLAYHMGLTTPSTTLGEARDLIRSEDHNSGGTGFGWQFDHGATCQGGDNWTIVSKSGSVGTQQAFIAYLKDANSENAVSPRGVVLLINREPLDDDFSLEDLGIELLQKLRP